jgi:hypothetical protein
MPDAKNHTPVRHFRLGEPTMAAIDIIADRYQVDRTTALKIAVHGFLKYEIDAGKKSPKKSKKTT